MIAETVALAEAVIRTRRSVAERRLRAAMATIWRRQAKATPWSTLAAGAQRYAPAALVEVANPQPGDPLTDLVVAHWADAEADIARVVNLWGTRAAMTAMNLTLAQIGYPHADTLLPVVRDVLANNALAHAADIERTSVMRLRGLLARAVDEGQSTKAIARLLRAEMEGWTKTRAETVARTEVATAWEGAQYEVLAANGWAGREWLTAEDERVDGGRESGPCIANAAAGAVAIGVPFPSGHLYPPAHPNCRCTTAPAFG
ncbi:MAG: phage head morphogenesis protein [Dehalococcoidia bacterium]|nr:phage head morphogenesis protein [Dehalococcoidia bacterium]